MRDPYAVLGVKRDADANEIKSAWRTMAKKIHPDQNRSDPNAARRFAEAGEAYEVLRDPKKRSRYDMLSQSGRQEATIQQQRDAAREAAARQKAAEESARKVMEELAKAEAEKARKAAAEAAARAGQDKSQQEKPAQDKSGQNPNPGQGQSQAQGQAQPQAKQASADQPSGQASANAGGESPEAVIDRIFGAQPQFTVSGEQMNATSQAGAPSGAETAAEPERSGAPSGSANSGKPLPLAAMEAISAFIRRLTGGTQPEKAPDQFAEVRVTIEDMLKENWVTVALPEGRDLKFRLEPGVTDGQAVRIKGQGYKVPGLARGDAVVTLRVEPSPLFRTAGHDIYTALPVTLENAVLGCTARVETPTGPIDVEVPSWSGSDQVIRIPGQGLLDGKGGRGDLVAEVRILLWEKPDAKVTDLMRSMREGLYL